MRDFDWKILLVLRQTRNITKTSELLFISQPTLTKRIQVMETELGTQLVVRGKHGSELTTAGICIAMKAEKVVEAIQEAKNVATDYNSGTKGLLRLGVPYSYVRYILPKCLSMFSKEYPQVEVDIVTNLSHELVSQVEDGTLDLCIARYNANDSFLERKLMSEDQIYAAYYKPFVVEDLPNLPYIEFNKNNAVVQAIKHWWSERFDIPETVRYNVSNGDCCMSMVKHGLGYGIFADKKYIQPNDKDNLHIIPLVYQDGTFFTRKTYLLYQKRSLNNKVVSNFIDYISNLNPTFLNGG